MKKLKSVLLSLCLAPLTALAADQLIYLDSPAGQQLFAESQHKASYWKLQRYFVSERGLTWCAIASDVMVLNALNIKPSISIEHHPYAMHTQDEFFNNPKALQIRSPAKVYRHGVTLDENSNLLRASGAHVKRVYANQSSAKEFRQRALASVSGNKTITIVNYLRSEINQKTGGHVSPLAAYHAKTDRFLILDVARYKYPPVWVKTADLFYAMAAGIDSESHEHRGYLLVSR